MGLVPPSSRTRMAFSRLLLAFTAFVAGIAALPLSGRSVPTGWSLHRRADPDLLIPLKFSLAQSNIDKLEAFLAECDSDERYHPMYGDWESYKAKRVTRKKGEPEDTRWQWIDRRKPEM